MLNTPNSQRPHIAFFGRRNSGKSSLINAITGQDIATVSKEAGTTTDPVYKAMELLPYGPVVFVDTAGLDDEGELGELRIKKTKEVMKKTDLGLIILDPELGIGETELEIEEKLKALDIPVIRVVNKVDINNSRLNSKDFLKVSALTKVGLEELRERIIENLTQDQEETPLLKDFLHKGDRVLLVVPIDSSAPKGRLILPQVQVLREILDAQAIALVCQVEELKATLNSLGEKPNLVITDSQVFKEVSQILEKDIPLTSFSILMARYKGDLKEYLEGVAVLKQLKPGDKVLISEACTHQRQHEDIGTIKIPKALEGLVGGSLSFEWVRGSDFPEDLAKYKLIIHCGGCMLTRKEILNRIKKIKAHETQVINYGILLAYLSGILPRTIAPLERGCDRC